MEREENNHGQEAGIVVQITCDMEVEAEFLRIMRKANIRALDENVDTLPLLPNNTVTNEERTRPTIAHLETIVSKRRTCADGAKFDATRQDFTDMLPSVHQRLQCERKEEEARIMR